MNSFTSLPDASDYRLINAAIPAILLADKHGAGTSDGLVRLDVTIRDGHIDTIVGAGQETNSALPAVDLDGGMLWPCFTDMHTHLDKGHIWRRQPNPDGSFDGALAAAATDRAANWSAADVAQRMDFSLRCAYAHGTAVIRTHLDSIAPQHHISWPVFDLMREQWAGRIDLQAASLVPIDNFADPAFTREIVATVAHHRGVLGAVTYMVPDLDRLLDTVMQSASDAGLDLDFHVDETDDPTARSLRAITRAVTRNSYQGRVVVGHCCSLATQPEDEAKATIAAVAEAGIAVVSLPMCNLYLQDRERGRTPRWRGVTLLKELSLAGVAVAVASDNTRDPFYAYGDLDVLEVHREAVRIAHLDHPVDASPAFVTRTPAAIIGRPDRGTIAAGGPADLVAFSARSYSELLARPQSDRIVIRGGLAIDRTLPDYRELDSLMDPSA
jgi:cytosine deaminase